MLKAFTRFLTFALVALALPFVTLPFVVRTVQPVLEDLALAVEEAAATLGATRWQTFWRVIFPVMRPINIVIMVVTVIESLRERGLRGPSPRSTGASTASRSARASSGRMVIVLSGGQRVIVGSDVDAAALRRVLYVLEQR